MLSVCCHFSTRHWRTWLTTDQKVTALYNGKSARAPSLYFIVLTVTLLATHPTSVVSPPPDASIVINRMQIGTVKKPTARLQNVSTAAELTRPVLPTVLSSSSSSSSVSYISGNRASRSQPHLPYNSSKLTSEFSSRRRHQPTAHYMDSNRISASDHNWSTVPQLFAWHRKILSLKV